MICALQSIRVHPKDIYLISKLLRTVHLKAPLELKYDQSQLTVYANKDMLSISRSSGVNL